ncbi:hypothetical protein KUTeg_012317 [Tegillarca granosa]|uniref:Thioredoxin-like fold domain-containing protein n=1 Tax=Tegillarca granosa TaxID=220873 RepID=A0ABQ9F3I2_TEGGR|nr:hypothetical protein KUTeg_012317 [Tegillarca granosa]
MVFYGIMAWYSNITTYIQKNPTRIGVVTAIVGISYVCYRRFRAKKSRNLWREEWKKDVVYLHVFPRNLAKSVPNMSPYAMKLETWLRINNIPYEIVDFFGMSSKGQSPFILFNGEEIPDSHFIIEFLSQYFNIDSELNKKEEATSRAFQLMIENHTKWTIFWYQFVDHGEDEYSHYLRIPGNFLFRWYLLRSIFKNVRKAAWYVGIGRHSNEEIYKLSSEDILAISDFLGENEYMMGDKPTLVSKY